MKVNPHKKFERTFTVNGKFATDRIKEILELFKRHKPLTGSKIAKEISVVYKHANKILNDMIKNGLIKVNNSSRPYVYFLGDKSESKKV
jgi:predicted transcriptional regulator